MSSNQMSTDQYQVLNRKPLVLSVPPQLIDPKRVDLDYYEPQYVNAAEEILCCGLPHKCLDELRHSRRPITDGIRERDIREDGIPLIRTQDFDGVSVNLENCMRVSWKQHKQNSKSKPERGDLLIAIGGYLGNAALVSEEISQANIDRHIALVPISNRLVDVAYVWAFITSQLGTAILNREATGTVQRGVKLPNIRSLIVPLPPRPVQEYIGAKVRLAERCRTQAKELQKHIEELLESMLHLDDFALVDEKIAWAQPQDVVTRWLNSGFYLPRYSKLQQHLKSAGLQIVSLSELATCVRTKQRPRHGSIRYIQIGDIDITSGMITAWSWYEAEDAPNNAQRLISDWDVLVSTRRPTRRAVTVVPEELAGSYASVFLARLRAKPGNSPYYIQQYLRSIVGVLFLEQRCTETTYPVISEDDLETVPIPIVESEVQKEIEASTRSYEKLLSMSANLVREAEADVKALIEGRLDVEGIVAGRIQPPAWEDLEV